MNKKSNKLISALTGLNKIQRKQCRKLISSAYFSGNKDLVSFYDEILKRIDHNKDLQKQLVWESVMPKSKPFNDVRFRKFTSDLFKLVREFLIQEALDEDPSLKDYLYLAALEKQNPDKLIRGIERNWQDFTTNPTGYDYYAFLYQHLLENRKYSLLNYEHRPYERANIEDISHSLDIYFIVVKLRNAVYSLSRAQTTKNYELFLVDEIVDFLEEKKYYLDVPVVAIHYYMYRMLASDDREDAYFQYKKNILKHGESMDFGSAYDYFQPALNFCRRRINEGRSNFLAEYLEIYRHALELGLLYKENKLDPLQFRNTILIALRHGDYKWTEHYIETYKDRLPAKQRDNAVKYNSATLYFYQKDYDKALEFLRDVEYENTTYNLNAKTMLLAIYYETKEVSALDSLFDSISAYLNRHKELPDSAQKAFRNLVTFTRRLTRIIPGDKEAIEQLAQDLSKKKFVASRPWLEEKIREF